MPELSVGQANATVIIPNVPMLTAAAQVAQRSFFERIYINTQIRKYSEPFRVWNFL